jgi:hypothetical protein
MLGVVSRLEEGGARREGEGRGDGHKSVVHGDDEDFSCGREFGLGMWESEHVGPCCY